MTKLDRELNNLVKHYDKTVADLKNQRQKLLDYIRKEPFSPKILEVKEALQHIEHILKTMEERKNGK